MYMSATHGFLTGFMCLDVQSSSSNSFREMRQPSPTLFPLLEFKGYLARDIVECIFVSREQNPALKAVSLTLFYGDDREMACRQIMWYEI